MDKIRDEFEAWARKSINPNSGAFFSIKRNGGFYFNQDTHVAWVSWQASRAALVVELPATCCRTLVFEQDNSLEVGMEHGEYYEPNDISEALDKAGIKYD